MNVRRFHPAYRPLYLPHRRGRNGVPSPAAYAESWRWLTSLAVAAAR